MIPYLFRCDLASARIVTSIPLPLVHCMCHMLSTPLRSSIMIVCSMSHMSSKENKKQKKKQADMNAMRKGAERMRNNNTNNKNTNNKKKSKKYKKKDCVEESGIGEFVNMLQKIGYCDKRARAKPSNAMSLSPMSQASDEAIDRPDDDEDHALLKEMEQLDAFSDDDDEKSE
eukprot:1115853_1